MFYIKSSSKGSFQFLKLYFWFSVQIFKFYNFSNFNFSYFQFFIFNFPFQFWFSVLQFYFLVFKLDFQLFNFSVLQFLIFKFSTFQLFISHKIFVLMCFNLKSMTNMSLSLKFLVDTKKFSVDVIWCDESLRLPICFSCWC